MHIEVAVAKVPKWASQESGDTLEMIERPRGGFSFVLADGQGSGRAAKAISQQVARKAIAELAEGVRDGAAARAAHDFLYTHKGGRVSATLNILSVDLTTGTLVLSRNNPHPVIVVRPDGEVNMLDAPSQPVGFTPAPVRPSPRWRWNRAWWLSSTPTGWRWLERDGAGRWTSPAVVGGDGRTGPGCPADGRRPAGPRAGAGSEPPPG
jgi:hypothetical protein